MPTSRYCDQEPLLLEMVLEAFGRGGAGLDRRQIGADHVRDGGADRLGLGGITAACSSITRSSMLVAKVTPEALMAWRSAGASR